jgi:hypothetical protein
MIQGTKQYGDPSRDRFLFRFPTRRRWRGPHRNVSRHFPPGGWSGGSRAGDQPGSSATRRLAGGAACVVAREGRQRLSPSLGRSTSADRRRADRRVRISADRRIFPGFRHDEESTLISVPPSSSSEFSGALLGSLEAPFCAKFSSIGCSCSGE